MKRIRLTEEKTTQVGLTPEQEENDRVDYIACIRQILRQPAKGIPWLEDAEKSIRIVHALDGKKLGDILELEDADHAHLCVHVKEASWAVFDERLLRFAHAILNATEHVLDEPTAGKSNGVAALTDRTHGGSQPAAGGVVSNDRRIRPRSKSGSVSAH